METIKIAFIGGKIIEDEGMTAVTRKIISISSNSRLPDRLQRLFANQAVQVSRVANFDAILEKFKTGSYDVVVLSSAACREQDKPDLVKSLQGLTAGCPGAQIIFLVEPKDVDLAIQSLKAGTFQYAKLPVTDKELQLLIETALEQKPQIDTNRSLREGNRQDRFEQFIGRSLPMQKVYQQIRQASATNIPVLLIGETGTGKDLAAKAIHLRSSRREGPYIPVHLGATPSDLVSSELFGHEKGAFTGAVKQQKGKFELGDHGTVFLDEIDTIEEKVQVSLLRLIEQKKFHRIGGKKAISSDVRIIAATNAEIEDLMEEGLFREDLFFRLDVFRINLPPLRKRQGDIPLLVEEFIMRFNRSLNKNILGITPDCLHTLTGYHWPGNVRELKNVIQRAVLICNGDTILPEHLPSRFYSERPARPTVTFEIGTPLNEVEREMIVRALTMANNNRTRAAELLGISRRAIYNKLKKHNIE